MKQIQFILLFMFIAWTSIAQNAYNIIPLPQSLKPADGSFSVKKGISVYINSEEFSPSADMLVLQIKNVSGQIVPVKIAKTASSGIIFSKNEALGEEAYSLKVTSKKSKFKQRLEKVLFMVCRLYSN